MLVDAFMLSMPLWGSLAGMLMAIIVVDSI